MSAARGTGSDAFSDPVQPDNVPPVRRPRGHRPDPGPDPAPTAEQAPTAAPVQQPPPPAPPAPQYPAPPMGYGAPGPAPAGAYPATVPGVPRLPVSHLSPGEQARWRHTLRAAAGKLAATYRAAAGAEDDWAALLADAHARNVPPTMITAAMADAGLPTDTPMHHPT